jgi:hypothetical protein
MIMTFRGSIKCGKFVIRLSSVSNWPIVNKKWTDYTFKKRAINNNELKLNGQDRRCGCVLQVQIAISLICYKSVTTQNLVFF